MDTKPKATPKDFFLWAGAMISLYAGVFAFISLLFAYIEKAFPKPVTDSYYYYDQYFSTVSYEMASLIVLVPLFLILMRLIRREIAKDSSRADVWVRRWALFLTLFVAGATIVIDLIVLLTTFLQGEDMTAGFLLKVLVVLLVASAGFLHFLADMRGYWDQNPSRARMVNWGVGALVVIAIIAGFFIVGTPQEIRQQKQDATRVQDLQNIQWQIVNYYQETERLPSSLEEVGDPIRGFFVPSDPKTNEGYEYEVTGSLSFSLCATFETEGPSVAAERVAPRLEGGLSENWQHGIGRTCFERTIDPDRYPPFSQNR